MLILLRTEFGEFLRQRRVGHGEVGNRMQRRIRRARFANREGRYRHTFGHLHNRIQRILSAQMFGRDGHAKHGDDGFGREHSRQMCRTARTCARRG